MPTPRSRSAGTHNGDDIAFKLAFNHLNSSNDKADKNSKSSPGLNSKNNSHRLHTAASPSANNPLNSPSSLSTFANNLSLRSSKFQPLSVMLRKKAIPELSEEDRNYLYSEWGYEAVEDVLEQAEVVYLGLDNQRDGKLQQSSFAKILGVMGSPLSRLSYLIFSALDINDDGELSFMEFVSWMMVMLHGTFEQKLHFGFRIMDLDKDNTISKHEMIHTLQSLFHLMTGLNIEPPDIDTFVNELFEKCGLAEGEQQNGITWERYYELCSKDQNFLKNFGGYSGEILNEKNKIDIKSKSGRKVFFGSENWDFMFSVMLGVQLSIDRSRTRSNMDINTPKTASKLGSKSEDNNSNDGLASIEHAQGLDNYLAKESFDLPSQENASSSSKVSVTCHYPEIFQQIREVYGVSNQSFLDSVGVKQVMGSLLMGDLTTMSGLVSEGKSGSFFYYSHDGQYMFKTISTSESNSLLNMLAGYLSFIKNNPTTLLTRYFGLYRIRFRKVKTQFVVMGNVFHTSLPMHVRFDLKGSMYGRTSLNENVTHFSDNEIIYKDLDWLASGRRLRLGKKVTKSLWEQLQRDADFLRDNGVLDYSLLIGIHNCADSLAETRDKFIKNNRDLLQKRYEKLKETSEDGFLFASLDFDAFCMLAFEHHTQDDETHARHISRHWQPKTQPGSGFGPLPCVDVNQHCHTTWGETVVFIGIIDTLITFEGFKQAEHLVKSVIHHHKQVSVVPPNEYCNRFLKFVRQHVLDGLPVLTAPHRVQNSRDALSSGSSAGSYSTSHPPTPSCPSPVIGERKHTRKKSWSATSSHSTSSGKDRERDSSSTSGGRTRKNTSRSLTNVVAS
eukprot:CFRG0889T1